jgi:DNA-binding HxlR family transcriptional regulator
VPDKGEEVSPLTILEKSHNISIIMALFRNGMMNRNQLYQELGETINIVMKRIDLLTEHELVYEKKMKVKPFTKGIALTYKGRDVAKELDKIEKTLKSPTLNITYRVNYPFKTDKELEEEVGPEKDSHFYYEVFLEKLQCNKCRSKTFLMKDKNKFVWVCFECGNKVDADIEDAKRLMLWES